MNYIPQTGQTHRPLIVWIVIALGTLLVMSLIVGAPLAAANNHHAIAGTLYFSFSHVCHQMPDRAFFVQGHPFAVCSRCTGIYAGFMLATIVYPLLRSLRQTSAPPRKWLFIAAAPLAVDFTLGFLGIWYNTHSSRFATGALLGAVAVLYIMPGLMDLAGRDWRKAEKTSPLPSRTTSTREVSSTTLSDYSAPHRRI